MKYIRTKDGIMKIDFEIETELPTMIGIQTEECEVGEYRGIEVIKQADTIEELFDEFIITEYTTIPKRCDVGIKKLFGKKSKYLTIELNAYGERRGYDLMTFLRTKPKCCIFGAIWTDKGLIYVARMNDKGELELL